VEKTTILQAKICRKDNTCLKKSCVPAQFIGGCPTALPQRKASSQAEARRPRPLGADGPVGEGGTGAGQKALRSAELGPIPDFIPRSAMDQTLFDTVIQESRKYLTDVFETTSFAADDPALGTLEEPLTVGGCRYSLRYFRGLTSHAIDGTD